MKTNIWFIIALVILFFAGAIWVSEVPVVATLVAALEAVAGFFAGYFYKKFEDKAEIEALTAENEALKTKKTKTTK